MIIGKRIRLRAIERSDLPLFVEWLNDPEVRHYLDLYLPLSMADEEKWFESVNSRPDERPFVIEIGASDEWVPIGNVSFMNMDLRNRSAEIGIMIGEKQYWNQGYGRETMITMLQHGFETLNLNRIFLRVYEPNQRGKRSYEHAGFVEEGCMRQAVYLDGEYYDVYFMSVLREEWQAQKI